MSIRDAVQRMTAPGPRGLTRERYDELCRIADEEVKSNGGHSYETILKTRCQHCGRSPRAHGVCRGWFQTWVDTLYRHLAAELSEPAAPAPYSVLTNQTPAPVIAEDSQPARVGGRES